MMKTFGTNFRVGELDMCVACKKDAPLEYIAISNDVKLNEYYDCGDSLMYCKHCGCVFISGPQLTINDEEE